MNRQTPLIAGPIALWLLTSVSPPAQPAEHPTLVDVATADCAMCHEDLLEGKTVVHSPVADDCTMCHEFSKDDTGTVVQLVEAEPGLCLMCHDDLSAAVALELEAPHMAVEDSCLTCHDPHAAEQEKLKLAGTAELCANCHDTADLAEVHGGQLTEATNCASCHAPHGSNNPKMLVAKQQHAPFADGSCSGCHREPFGTRIRLRARGERLCTACHGEFPVYDGGSNHAALTGEAGKAGCLSCHDPHMSPNRAMLLQSGPSLCGDCHPEITAAARSETGHAAADDCTSCHMPHTAEQPLLLSVPQGELCALCHDLEDEDLASRHLGAELASLSCTSCHSPHGAGHPSLLAENLHPPIEDGCDTCHEGGFDELAEGGSADLCLMCHDDIGELASSASVPHAAMEMEDCTLCHNPHASPQRKLVKLPGGGACAECHDDKAAGDGEFAHGVVGLIGCEACHEPHGSENDILLRASGSELCLACHGSDRPSASASEAPIPVLAGIEMTSDELEATPSLTLSADGEHDHPITDHRVLGTPTKEELRNVATTFKEELTCLTCHDPHKGASPQILRWGAATAMDLCQECHLK